MKKIDWTPIIVPVVFAAAIAGCAMMVGSLIWLIRRHHVSALAAKAAAPVGATFTVIGLVTGAIWGQPMWGTWWAWDPRLTAFLILFLFYLGYMALQAAIDAYSGTGGLVLEYTGQFDFTSIKDPCVQHTLPAQTIEIGAGDAFRYRPGTVHRITAIEDTTIVEVSTPDLDDVVRLEDRYGRPDRDA